MIDYKAEATAVLTRAMRNYSKAVRYNESKWTKEDRVLKQTVRKIIGDKRKK